MREVGETIGNGEEMIEKAHEILLEELEKGTNTAQAEVMINTLHMEILVDVRAALVAITDELTWFRKHGFTVDMAEQ